MQRNSNILIKTKMRSGMAMIMAIAFLVVIAGMMAIMLNMSSLANKRTEHIYFTEQAQLLAKSATEFALLAISGHNRAGDSCVQTVTSTYPAVNPFFNINTTIRYIGLNAANPSTCFTNAFINPALTSTPPSLTTSQSEGTVLIDVYVTSIDATLNVGETINFHRRTMQKP